MVIHHNGSEVLWLSRGHGSGWMPIVDSTLLVLLRHFHSLQVIPARLRAQLALGTPPTPWTEVAFAHKGKATRIRLNLFDALVTHW